MQTPDFDLVIVGAGPAGCTTALKLAGSGIKVALIDKAVLPADKTCGDALSGTVLQVLRRLPDCYDEFLKLEPKNPSWGIRFAAPSGEFLDVPFILDRKPETPPPGYLIKRKLFDGFLQQKVRDLTHFPVIDNFKAEQIIREKEFLIIKSEKGDLKCRIVMGADGALSTVGRILAKHPVNYKHYCFGVRTYFSGVTDLHPEHFIELHFLEELLPGYLWIFPLADGLANVGLGMLYEKMKATGILACNAEGDYLDPPFNFKEVFQSCYERKDRSTRTSSWS